MYMATTCTLPSLAPTVKQFLQVAGEPTDAVPYAPGVSRVTTSVNYAHEDSANDVFRVGEGGGIMRMQMGDCLDCQRRT